MDNMQLTQMVTEAQSGDKKAMKELYLEFVKTVYYFALKATQSNEDAEDITQIVFITVYEKISDLKQPEAFAGWIKRITANKCADYFRKQGNDFSYDTFDADSVEFLQEDDPLLIPEKAFDNAETARMITGIIDLLPDSQRLCIYYYYYEQLTIAQMAEILDANENAVKKRLQLARGKIRKELEQLYEKEGVKLYSTTPLLLTPVLKLALQNFEMPAQLSASIWGGITSQSVTIAESAAVMGIKAKAAMVIFSTVLIGGIIAGDTIINDALPVVAEIAEDESTAASETTTAASETAAVPALKPEHSGPSQPSQPGTTPTVPAPTASPPASQPGLTVPSASVKIGDIIKIGGYDWRVYDIKDGKAFIISVQILAARQYHSDRKAYVTWESSDIREWLNGSFYNDTFTAQEKMLISAARIANKDNQWYGTDGGNDTTDKIFLLSAEETVKYFGDSGQLGARPSGARYINDRYNQARSAFNIDDGKAMWWWLRSSGNSTNRAACINNDGDIDLQGDIGDNKNGGVRPAMWIVCD